MAKNSQDKVLIVGPSWVGDMVMSQALYKALKETFNDDEYKFIAFSKDSHQAVIKII